MRRFAAIALIQACIAGGLAAPLVHSQADTQGPIAPPPKFEVRRIPSTPHPGPPPIPEQQIIQKFAANEDTMKQAFDTYTYTEIVRFQEMTDPGGTLTISGDTYLRASGERYLRMTKEPVSNLKITHFSAQDVAAMAGIPFFFLTTTDISNYNFVYAGQQQLDTLNTYAFQVKPKVLSRTKRLFEGVVWIDDQDFAIVKSFGKFELAVESDEGRLPFTMFETYRENFQNKYWLPTYTESDDEVKIKDQDPEPVHLIIRATDFKHIDNTTPVNGQPTPADAAPASPAR